MLIPFDDDDEEKSPPSDTRKLRDALEQPLQGTPSDRFALSLHEDC